MPPPKQNPTVPTLCVGWRRSNSVTAAFMSSTKRWGGTAFSAAVS
jgi:hypothetical protein